MPIDIPATARAAYWSCMQAGITAYNVAVGAGSLPGCPPVRDGILDDLGNAREQAPLATAASSFPLVRLSIVGDSQARTATPTFSLMAGVSGVDAIVPITVTLEELIAHEMIQDAAQTPLEAYIDSFVRAAFPKLGLSYCSGFTSSSRRRQEMFNGAERTVRRKTVVITLRPHLSSLT